MDLLAKHLQLMTAPDDRRERPGQVSVQRGLWGVGTVHVRSRQLFQVVDRFRLACHLQKELTLLRRDLQMCGQQLGDLAGRTPLV